MGVPHIPNPFPPLKACVRHASSFWSSLHKLKCSMGRQLDTCIIYSLILSTLSRICILGKRLADFLRGGTKNPAKPPPQPELVFENNGYKFSNTKVGNKTFHIHQTFDDSILFIHYLFFTS